MRSVRGRGWRAGGRTRQAVPAGILGHFFGLEPRPGVQMVCERSGPQAVFVAWIVALLAALPAASAEKVVLRGAGGTAVGAGRKRHAACRAVRSRREADLRPGLPCRAAGRGKGAGRLLAGRRRPRRFHAPPGCRGRGAGGARDFRVGAGRGGPHRAFARGGPAQLLVFGPAAGPRPPRAALPEPCRREPWRSARFANCRRCSRSTCGP